MFWTIIDTDIIRYRGANVENIPSYEAALEILPAFQSADIQSPEGRIVARYNLFTGVTQLDPTPTVK